MKHIISVLLLCLTSLATFAYDVEVNGIYYLLNNEEGTATVTFGSEKYSGNIIIPNSISYNGKSYNVTEVGAFAFIDCTSLTSVTIPSGVTTIGWDALQGSTSLKSITLGEKVALIAPEAFSGCTALTTIKSESETAPSIYNASTFGEGVAPMVYVNGADATSSYQGAYAWPTPDNRYGDLNDVSSTLTVYNGSGQVSSQTGELSDAALIGKDKNTFVFVDKKVSSTDDLAANVIAQNESGEWIAKEINLTDAVAYALPYDVHADKVTYTRNFGTTNYQALYIPFELKESDWTGKAKIKYFNDVRQPDEDGDGQPDKTVVEIFTVTSGKTRPNIPYVIQALATGPVTLTGNDVELKATGVEGFVDCTSTSMKYTITGNYQTKKDVYSTNSYVISAGQFMNVTSDEVPLSPFRLYMNVESRFGDGVMTQAPRAISIIDDGIEESTSIEGISTENGTYNYFDLQGRKVTKPNNGIYILNGKKIKITNHR